MLYGDYKPEINRIKNFYKGEKMKILSIIGARPQFVKEAIVQNEINKFQDIEEMVVHTGQHYDNNMSGIFFELLGIREPDYNLGIKASNHGEMTGKMLIELEKIMIQEKPDLVLVYGDTNSTLAGAIAAAKLKIKIAHVEAGLRQEPRDMPEETNRVLTDRISTILFTPSTTGTENLKKEGIINNVYFTGDVMYDIFLKMKPKFDYSILENLKVKPNEYIMMTLHRDFNVDNPKKLEKILKEVNKISKEIKIVLPIHPRTKKRIEKFEFNHLLSNVKVIDPIDYLKLMALTENCYKVVTDSGGYQKEAYFAKKEACIIMPDTSWRELVHCGVNKLTDENNLYKDVITDTKVNYIEGIYGNGDASKKIISILRNR